MFCKLLFLIALCYSTQGIQITIENNFARDVYSSATYLPSGGISRLPRVISPGEQDTVEINDEDIYFNIQGLLVLRPQGKDALPIAIAWDIPKDDMISGTNNIIAIASESFTNTQTLYNKLMNSSEPYKRRARDGWFDVSFADGSGATVFMASDSSSSIFISLQENKRFPSGEYYIQAYNTSYFMYKSNSTVNTLEHLTPSNNTGFRWNITRQDSTLNYLYTFASMINATEEVFANNNDYFVTKVGVHTSTLTNETNLGFFWSFKPAGRDLFVIQSRRYAKNIDLSSCRDSITSANEPCVLSSEITLQPITDDASKTNNRLWRLIPV